MKFGFLKSRIFLLFALGVIVLLIYANLQINKKNKQEQVSLLKKQFQEEQEKNQGLANLKEYLNTDIYLERQAREKFKMQKPGEKTIIIQEIENKIIHDTEPEKDIANFIKWWYYLFK